MTAEKSTLALAQLTRYHVSIMRKKLGRSTNLVRSENPPPVTGQVIFDRSFPSLKETKNAVLDGLLLLFSKNGIIGSEQEEARIRLCLDEALVNAMMHGNCYDPQKNVRIRAFLTESCWCALIEDEGTGFREEDLPDPNASENLLEESGRGVSIIQNMMDEISYWRGGSALFMLKRILKRN